MSYLRHIISHRGLALEPDKLEMIHKWPVPVMCRKISLFLGFTSYYRKFIDCFLCKVTALQKEKNSLESKFCWLDECDREFRELVEEFANTVILAFPDFSKDFYLETDACRDGLGACLSQSCQCPTNEKHSYLHPIQFASRTTNSAEKNYSPKRKLLESLCIQNKTGRLCNNGLSVQIPAVWDTCRPKIMQELVRTV